MYVYATVCTVACIHITMFLTAPPSVFRSHSCNLTMYKVTNLQYLCPCVHAYMLHQLLDVCIYAHTYMYLCVWRNTIPCTLMYKVTNLQYLSLCVRAYMLHHLLDVCIHYTCVCTYVFVCSKKFNTPVHIPLCIRVSVLV